MDVCRVCLLSVLSLEAGACCLPSRFWALPKGLVMKTVVNHALAAAKAQYSVAEKAHRAAKEATKAAEAKILVLLSKILGENPGAREALVAMGHRTPKQQVSFLISYCKYESDVSAHHARLREIAFICTFGLIKDLPAIEQDKRIFAMTRKAGRKGLENFIKNGIGPLDIAVSEFIRAESEEESARRALVRAKALEIAEFRKIGVYHR